MTVTWTIIDTDLAPTALWPQMDVIEISSSPEPPDFAALKRKDRRPVRGRGRTRARTHPVDIVDITDSDSEFWSAQELPLAASNAGPSTGTSSVQVTDDEDPFPAGTGASTSFTAADPLAQVLEIVPDVEPNYAQELIAKNLPTFGDKVVETVLHTLFEDAGYPKAEKKRKAASGSGSGGSVAKKARVGGEVDYASTDRPFAGGPDYAELAIVRPLLFPEIFILIRACTGSTDTGLSQHAQAFSPEASQCERGFLRADIPSHRSRAEARSKA